MQSRDPKARFSDRVADYIRYRPSYPEALIDYLSAQCNLGHNTVVADIGSGTGKLTALLLDRCWLVHAVEPNAPMRLAAEEIPSGHADFHSSPGSAEATGLANASVNLITVAQAFHWFDPLNFRREAYRILRKDGHVAIVWNSRRLDTPFMRGYHEALLEFVPEYEFTREKSRHEPPIKEFFGHEYYNRMSFPYVQMFDWEGLRGRLMSASYCPKPGEAQHIPLMDKLRGLFERLAKGGQVEFAMDTVVFHGLVAPLSLIPQQ